MHAADVRAVIEAVGGGPVDLFGSSGGAVNAFRPRRWAPRARADPRCPRAASCERAAGRRRGARRLLCRPRDLPSARVGPRDGALHCAGLAARSGAGRVCPAAGARSGDVRHADGGRRRPRRPDARLEHRHRHHYRPDVDATAASSRIGSLSVPARTASSRTVVAEAVAELLGTSPVTFPGGHDGFLGGEYGQTGEPTPSPPGCATSSATKADKRSAGAARCAPSSLWATASAEPPWNSTVGTQPQDDEIRRVEAPRLLIGSPRELGRAVRGALRRVVSGDDGRRAVLRQPRSRDRRAARRARRRQRPRGDSRGARDRSHGYRDRLLAGDARAGPYGGRQARVALDLRQGDMRDLELDEPAGLIYCPYPSAPSPPDVG